MNKPIEPKERLDIQAILSMGATSGPGSRRRRVLIWVAIVLGALLISWIVWSFTSSTNAVRYVTESVTRGNLIVIVTATGSVQPTNKVDVSSELSGTVRKVFVDYNTPVKAGQVLAELDTDKLVATVNSSRAKLAAARAKVTEVEATLRETERNLERHRRLAGTQAVSAREHDLAQAAHERATASLASARADVGVAEADLQLNETNLAKAYIRSPINGVILKRDVDPGQTVASSFQAPVLFSIAEDLTQMELQVDVDEADVGKVRIGHSASFSVDAYPDRKFPASIRDVRFASETVQGVVTYKAVLNIDNTELLLRPGMTATAEITVTEVRNALLVPNSTLRYTPAATTSRDSRSLVSRLLPGPPRFRAVAPREQTGHSRTVWVLRDGEPAPVNIEIGSSDGRRTEVRRGDVQVGQAVIVDQAASRQ